MIRTISLTAVLVSLLLFAAGAAADIFNYPVPSHECNVCRDACVNAGAQCKAKACRKLVGGSAVGHGCEGADSSTYGKGPQSCARAQSECWKKCARTTAFCMY